MTKVTISLLQILALQQLIWQASGKKNNKPIANPDTFFIEPNSMSNLNVLENDSDPKGDELYISQVAEAQNGYVAVLDGNNELLYVPDTDFVGVDTFGYSVCNSNSCSTAKVEVQVGSTSISQSGSGPQQNLLMAITNEVTHLNVLDYPISLSGELKVQKATKPQHGTLMVLSGKQEMIYSPEKDYVGEDVFELTVCNTSQECTSVQIDVTVRLFHCNTSTRNKVNLGYYQSWAIYRNSECNPIWPGDIKVDEFGYTHLAFSFAGISPDGKMEPYNGSSEYIAMYKDFNNLKARYPGLKTLIAVGGWSFQQSIFVKVASTEEMREYFAKTVVEFCEMYGFDGIDLDWEYPVTRQGTPADYDNYPLLCEAIRKAFNEAGHQDWLITVATAINPDKIKQGYDMVGIAPHIDFFNMMAYDIYGSWDSHAGANTDMEYITNTMQYIYEVGVPREKLVLGMAAYGRSMALKDQNCAENGCAVTGAGLTGCHGEMGNLPYFQIDEMVQYGDYDSLYFNERTGSMEMISGNSWTSYDSPDTLNLKYRYAFDQCLRGIMWWAVDLMAEKIDLFESQPSASPSLSISPSTFTKSPTRNPTSFPTSRPTDTPPCGFTCPEGAMGLLPTFDCTGYYSCKTGEPSEVTPCLSGTIFDEKLQTCNWPWATSCLCTKDTVQSPGLSSTPGPSPIPKKECNAEATLTVNFGYYESWASGRWCNSVQPGAIDVDAFGYTHLAFSFAGISSNGDLEPYDGDQTFIPMYEQFNSLKKRNPELKTLIAVGGWTFSQRKFVSVSSTEEKRAKFAKSVVRFLRAYSFDGIDLDWEYPVTRQGTPADYDNYPLLCEAIRKAFNDAGHPEWLITVATAINPDKIKQGYDMVGIAPHIDFFNMMSYDIYGSWDSHAGANADMRYIKNTMHYIFGLGVPRDKLVLGLAGYGRSMKLNDANCVTDGCPVSGAGLVGCHGEAGNLPYFQIDEEFVQTGKYDSLVLNEESGSMELITGGNAYFTSYDSPETFGIKYRYAFHECLRGIMWWAVDLLVDPIDLLQEYKPSVAPSVSVAPSTTTRSPSTHPTTAPTIRCGSQCPPNGSGFFSTMDCTGYFECRDGVLSSSAIMCHGGLVFNEEHQRCDWDYNTECTCTSEMYPPTTTQPTKRPVSAMPTKRPTTSKPSFSDYGVEEQSTSTNSDAKDDDKKEYYPDYDKSTCRNDGNAPEFETNFFMTFEECCQFPWVNTEKCLASKSETEEEYKWYPISDGFCVSGDEPPRNIALSDTVDECCTRFFSSSKKSCMQNSRRWYPDYGAGYCKNDGNHQKNVALTETYRICCDRFMSSDSKQCYFDSKAFIKNGGNNDMEQNSSPTGSGGDTPTDKKEYYPDYDISTCRNDGQAPKFETNFFSTFDGCCNFSWIDTEKCLANKPSTEWYPVADGSCTSGGTPPKNIAISDSLDECCNRFFPSSDCIYRSNFEMSQHMAQVELSDCESLNKRKCSRDESCIWNEDSSSCSLGHNHDSSDCHARRNKRQCKQDTLCFWNEATSTCNSHAIVASARPSSKPASVLLDMNNTPASCASLTSKKRCKQDTSCSWIESMGTCSAQPNTTTGPTIKPTKQSIVDTALKSCDSVNNKKQCTRKNSCEWNDLNDSCEDQVKDMKPNLSVALCSSGLCLDFQGECKAQYNCLVNPCDSKSCKSNEICESNYCGGCVARCVENTMKQHSSSITKSPTFKPSNKVTARPSHKPTNKPITSRPSNMEKPLTSSAAAEVEAVLEASKHGIDNKILLYQTPSNDWEPSSVYRYEDFIAALRVMYSDGVANKYFYMGDESPNGYQYGLVNIAAFLAQSMKETIQYNACDENNWDLVNGVYPVSNACGQLGQSYQDYKCTAAEAHMECEVDPDMTITATTNSKWWGAPSPLFCAPKSDVPFTGYWDYTLTCHDPWANPPKYCKDYEGQKAGGFNNDSPVANIAGRTDVEGCCFWGRGVIQTTGVCNFGKLNYYLGARAAKEGRESRYPDIDFCKHPDAICSSEEHKELKWIAGMFYWVESLQSYDVDGWNYIDELKSWVDGGMTGNSFIDSVSGIVNRGCHNPPCASGAVDGQFERATNFWKVLDELGL